MTNRMQILNNEYKIIDNLIKDDINLFRLDLDDKFAYSFFAPKLRKGALARDLTQEDLKDLIKKINPDNIIAESLIKVRIIGGNDSIESQESMKQLIEQLNQIDNNTNIIDIVSYDVNSNFHPNSFEFDCFTGNVIPLQPNSSLLEQATY